MTRYRWLRVEWPFSIRSLGNRLKSLPFDDASPHGFVVDRVRDEYLEARYIERVEYTESVVDPFGRELTFDRVEFRQSAFRAAVESPGLELVDAPRSIQNLMARLAEVTDFSIAIDPFALDVLAWADALQRAARVSHLVDSVQIGSLQVEDGIAAKVIVKGDRDVWAPTASWIGKRKFTLEKVQLKLQGSYSGSIMLAQSGTAKLDADDPSGDLVNALRQALTKVCR